MTAAQIRDHDETSRRAEVQNMAKREVVAEASKDTAIKVSTDLASAADAAITAAPVDLGQGQQDTLSAISNVGAQDTERYAGAQHQIFSEGRERETAYKNEYFDDQDKVRSSMNAALERFEVDMIAKKAAGQRRGGGVDGLGGWDPDDGYPEGSGYDDLQGALAATPDSAYRIGLPLATEPVTATNPLLQEHVNGADLLMEDLWFSGVSLGGALGQVFVFLTRNGGLSDNEARAIIADLTPTWENQWNSDNRGVVGGPANQGHDPTTDGFYGALYGDYDAVGPGGTGNAPGHVSSGLPTGTTYRPGTPTGPGTYVMPKGDPRPA